jgi:hypothetical protein
VNVSGGAHAATALANLGKQCFALSEGGADLGIEGLVTLQRTVDVSLREQGGDGIDFGVHLIEKVAEVPNDVVIGVAEGTNVGVELLELDRRQRRY